MDSERHRARRSFVGDRLATPAERAEFEAGWERFSAVAAKAAAKGAAEGTDTSVAEAVGGLRDDPWMATVETWEAAQIAAADPRLLSVIDLQRNQLEGSNLEVPGGLGDLVRRRLAPLAGEIRLGTPASRVMWDHGGGVTVETPAGRIEAGACIVTVSTGVLASGAIGFDPPLPAAVRDAIAHLPMGLLTKVALRATDADRFAGCRIIAGWRGGWRSASRRTSRSWPGRWDATISWVSWAATPHGDSRRRAMRRSTTSFARSSAG